MADLYLNTGSLCLCFSRLICPNLWTKLSNRMIIRAREANQDETPNSDQVTNQFNKRLRICKDGDRRIPGRGIGGRGGVKKDTSFFVIEEVRPLCARFPEVTHGFSSVVWYHFVDSRRAAAWQHSACLKCYRDVTLVFRCINLSRQKKKIFS